MVKSRTEFQVDDLKGEDFMNINHEAGHSAGGLDGWTTEDLGLITLKAAELIASMFNAIEKGAPWHKVMRQAKAALFAKNAKEKR